MVWNIENVSKLLGSIKYLDLIELLNDFYQAVVNAIIIDATLLITTCSMNVHLVFWDEWRPGM